LSLSKNREDENIYMIRQVNNSEKKEGSRGEQAPSKGEEKNSPFERLTGLKERGGSIQNPGNIHVYSVGELRQEETTGQNLKESAVPTGRREGGGRSTS